MGGARVGGGPAGLSAAQALSAAGQRAVLVEKEQQLGGAPILSGYAKLVPTGEWAKDAIGGMVSRVEGSDTVDVHNRILEGNKERTQIFNGVVIARSGSGSREMFTVRRIVSGEGVERKFPVHSPKIAKIVVKRSGVTRRAKLYYLRDRIGKAVRLRERRTDVASK